MDKLLPLEKERRGARQDQLVFLGVADIAQYYWCAAKALFKSRQMELAFFRSYLLDRLLYSLYLGRLDRLPVSSYDLLEVGSDISMADIEYLLSLSIVAKELPDTQINYLDDPKERGRLLQLTRAERYPTIRWNFEWENYVVVGVPDGITGDFAYEFKTTKSRFLSFFQKPVAFTQADLYGYLFRRSAKRVQIFIVDEEVTETWEEGTSESRAVETLASFRAMDMGDIPPSPKAWKCNSCEFRVGGYYNGRMEF
ncbi:MAG: hypothetical protein M1319_00045 [Chloroflexi bacterium]|nr:hypothetical protein [Chloroflexota bacterium]